MKEITVKELAEKLISGEKLSIIDVREDEEVVEGKIPGARHIRLGDLEEKLGEIEQGHHHYIVCRSGNRSGKACTFLEQHGYDVTNMVGGMLEWQDEVGK
ncbi:rhodanese-related sulfurtransferase [Salirhabdus euzebyi]|uniref:Rhodanese-related sulfurtransferase n=1 Tax=Salirhabdus euzebyi TaxID=394506 RepID=A0A841Q412_9BACI|nr:rhodanese-like domain-containing protein [Salirhabdus euzebyi]MBB6453146.1 rhodanese-related sulfurtransferase [Salirhabdus euzebyi]